MRLTMAAFGGGYSDSNRGEKIKRWYFCAAVKRRGRNPSSPWTIKAPANFYQSRLWKTCSWLWVTGPPGTRRWGRVCAHESAGARTPVCIISQCPEPWRSSNTSVAQARFIKNPGYRPAVKIEAAYLLHFVQINLKTCESYSLERWGEEVNNIRLILTSRGGERTKVQKAPRLQELFEMLCEMRGVGGWGVGAARGALSPATFCTDPCRLGDHFRADGSALCPGSLCCTRHILPFSMGLCCPPDAAAAILLSNGSCRN